MLRFPFNQGPYQPRQDNAETKPQTALVKQENTEEVKEKNEGLSPELSMLLSMAMKDGMQQNKMHSMFESILPFVSDKERDMIKKIMKPQGVSGIDHSRSSAGVNSLSGYTKRTKQQELMDVLEQYADSQGNDAIKQLKKSMEMQSEFEKASKRLGRLGNMQNAKPEELFEIMSMFMNGQDSEKMRNMQSMMKMFGSMNNLKPEDMLKFLNLNKK